LVIQIPRSVRLASAVDHAETPPEPLHVAAAGAWRQRHRAEGRGLPEEDERPVPERVDVAHVDREGTSAELECRLLAPHGGPGRGPSGAGPPRDGLPAPGISFTPSGVNPITAKTHAAMTAAAAPSRRSERASGRSARRPRTSLAARRTMAASTCFRSCVYAPRR